MKGKFTFCLFILIAGTAAYLLFDSSETMEQGEGITAIAPMEKAAPPVQRDAGENGQLSEREKRINAMRSEYARLEQARDTVRRQLAKLRSRLWKLQLPADQGRAITEQLQQGYAILKNPPMLGAFHDAREIRKELARVESISRKLKNVEDSVQEHISAQETSQ